MNWYRTRIKAVCPKTKELKVYFGPNVPGITFKDAETFCEVNELGYCEVVGLIHNEIEELKQTNILDEVFKKQNKFQN